MKVAIVTWLDAYFEQGVADPAAAPNYLMVKSVGWLVDENAEAVKLMTDLIDSGEDRDLHVILRKNIQQMVTLDVDVWTPAKKRARKKKAEGK